MDGLAQQGVGHAHHHGGGHVGVAAQGLLHLHGAELVAASADHFFLPAHQLHQAACMLARQVSGAEPALDKGVCGERWCVQVARQQVGAAQLQLTHLAQCQGLTLGIGNAVLHLGRGPSYATRALGKVSRESEKVAGGGFCQPVDVYQGALGKALAQVVGQ